jgi:hypothetical protein
MRIEEQNFEQPAQGSDFTKDDFFLGETNEIQKYLIFKSGLSPDEWIEKNAKNFRKIIEEKPKLIMKYRECSKNYQNPESILADIKKQLEEKRMISL